MKLCSKLGSYYQCVLMLLGVNMTRTTQQDSMVMAQQLQLKVCSREPENMGSTSQALQEHSKDSTTF